MTSKCFLPSITLDSGTRFWIENKFQRPSALGYRDVNVGVGIHLASGRVHISEIQLNLHSILNAKDQGHSAYEAIRSMLPILCPGLSYSSNPDGFGCIECQRNAEYKTLADAVYYRCSHRGLFAFDPTTAKCIISTAGVIPKKIVRAPKTKMRRFH